MEKFFPALIESGATVLHPIDIPGGVGPDPDELLPFVIFPPRAMPILPTAHRLIPGVFKLLEVGSDLGPGDRTSGEEKKNG